MSTMGLEISHGCFSGEDRTFDALRCVWADAAGYGVRDYRDIGGPIMPNIDYDLFTEGDMQGEWPDGAPNDPLAILLIHHEHEGRIKTQHCSYLADRLEEVEALLMKAHQTHWLLATQQFIRGLRTAAHHHQDVVFQ